MQDALRVTFPIRYERPLAPMDAREVVRPQSEFSCPLSVVRCPLSVVRCLLSVDRVVVLRPSREQFVRIGAWKAKGQRQ